MNQNIFCKNCHRIPSQCYCTPAKTLTDEEINKTYLEKYDGHMGFLSPDEVREFARAILRKAQEK
jgi:hypothetical protein